MKNAYENGYSVIRILQQNVHRNKNQWKAKLQKQIKSYKSPRVVCNGDVYKCFSKFIKNNCQ